MKDLIKLSIPSISWFASVENCLCAPRRTCPESRWNWREQLSTGKGERSICASDHCKNEQ
eukprot:1729822-Rhodomonas_salina.1